MSRCPGRLEDPLPLAVGDVDHYLLYRGRNDAQVVGPRDLMPVATVAAATAGDPEQAVADVTGNLMCGVDVVSKASRGGASSLCGRLCCPRVHHPVHIRESAVPASSSSTTPGPSPPVQMGERSPIGHTKGHGPKATRHAVDRHGVGADRMFRQPPSQEIYDGAAGASAGAPSPGGRLAHVRS
jgi:hypothetical protein